MNYSVYNEFDCGKAMDFCYCYLIGKRLKALVNTFR